MEKVWGNESILENSRHISENWDNFARYILNDTEGTCGKVSNNRAKQNHASQVAYAGGMLYKDPAFEIEILLYCQRMMAKKETRRNKNISYKFE